MKMQKKFLCLLMALCMVVTMTPTMALAAGTVVEVRTESDFGSVDSGKTYKLMEDITLDNSIEIASGETVTIDLNGHVLQGNGSDPVIKNNGTLTIEDSNTGNLTHYGTLEDVVTTFTPSGSSQPKTVTYEDALWVWDSAVTAETSGYIGLTGGIITGKVGGGSNISQGIHNNSEDATFYLNGGTFAGNIVTSNGLGAAVYNYKGKVYVNKAKIIYNVNTNNIGGGLATTDGTLVFGDDDCTDSDSCSHVYIKNNQSYYSGKDISLKASNGGAGLNVTFNCGQYGRTKFESSVSQASLASVTINGGTFEWIWLAHSPILCNINDGKINQFQSNGAQVIVNGNPDVTQIPGEETINLNGVNYNIKKIPIIVSNKSDPNNNRTCTLISPANIKPFVVAKSEDGTITYNLVWNKNTEDGLYYASLIVPGDETAILSYEGYAPAVTYKQISGKAETKNNDPLLVIGTVTGDEDFRPEGRLFYMFSGNLAGQESNFENNTEAMQSYGEALTRVMDSSAAFDSVIAAGSGAATTYNGYSDLQDADITFAADAGKMDGSGNWTDIPDELLDVPVRISLGQDVTKYYTDDTFTTEIDEANAAYRVDYTYEYTTRADNNGNAIKLGDLLSETGDYEMSYSDVSVYRKSGSDWVSEAGYNTSNVTGLTETVNYEFSGKFDDIKAAVLEYINDDDTANDFWNHAGSSFGLYVTYEYIAPNVCLSRYVPTDNTAYTAAYSAASLLVPGAETADFTYKVYKQTESTWTELTADGGKYVVDYDDSIMITTKDAANYSGTPNYNAAVQNDTFEFVAGTADGATAAFTFTPSDGDNEAGFEGLVTISRVYDGTYAQVDKQFTLLINERIDAQTPGITLPAKAVYVIEGGSSVSGIIEAEAVVNDGGSLTYQWYEVNGQNETAITGQTGLSLDLAQTTIAAGASKVYRIKITNTNNGPSINGNNVTSSYKDVEVSIISTDQGGSIEGEAIVYADGVAVTLPVDTAASVDNEGNITLSGGTMVGTVEIPEGAGTVRIPVGNLSEVADDGENVVLPAGSVVNKDGTTHNMPNGGKLNKNGDVITATISFVADNNGSLDGASSEVVDKGTLWQSITKPTATANTGYVFDKWTLADGTEEIAADYAVTGDITVKANFREKTSSGAGFGGGVFEQKVTIKNDGEGVTAKLESYGTKLTITVEEGYELVDVTVNGVSKGAVTSLSGLRSGDVVEIYSQKAGAGSSGGGTLSVVDVESLLAKLTPVARSSRTAKNNVKVVTNLGEVDEAIIRQIEDAGYTIKYNYYRSTQKSLKYKSMYIPKGTTYTNTMGVKGTMYYYKTRIQVYDINGELVARTELKQCRYANRIWNR